MYRVVPPPFIALVICAVALPATLHKLGSTIDAFNDLAAGDAGSGAVGGPGGVAACDCLTSMVRRKSELGLTPTASRFLSEVHQLTKERRKPNARGWYALCSSADKKGDQSCAANQVQSFMEKEFPLSKPDGGVASCTSFIELSSAQLSSTKAFARALMDTQAHPGRCVSIIGFNADEAPEEVTASIKGLLEVGTVGGVSIFGDGGKGRSSSIALLVSGSLKYGRVRSMLTELPISG
jgi:hypothetical protein